MTWLDVLVEGRSDVPVVEEILKRKFGLVRGHDFQVISHTGRGSLPNNPLDRPNPKRTALLDQLPAKLRAYANRHAPATVVMVLVDTDDTECSEVLRDLNRMLNVLPARPVVMFRLAIKEIESWFISDVNALRAAFPGKLKKNVLKDVQPDTETDAWELLAKALAANRAQTGEATKMDWATKISPYLDLDTPRSPSLRKFIEGVNKLIEARQ